MCNTFKMQVDSIWCIVSFFLSAQKLPLVTAIRLKFHVLHVFLVKKSLDFSLLLNQHFTKTSMHSPLLLSVLHVQ